MLEQVLSVKGTYEEKADSLDSLARSVVYDGDTVRPRQDIAAGVSDFFNALPGSSREEAALILYTLFSIPYVVANGRKHKIPPPTTEQDRVQQRIKELAPYDDEQISTLIRNTFRILDLSGINHHDEQYAIRKAVSDILSEDTMMAADFARSLVQRARYQLDKYDFRPTQILGDISYYVLLLAQKSTRIGGIDFTTLDSLYRMNGQRLGSRAEMVGSWKKIITALYEDIERFGGHEEEIGGPDKPFARENFFNLYDRGWNLHQTFHDRYEPRIMRRLGKLPGLDRRGVLVDLGSSAIVPLLSDLRNLKWKGGVFAYDLHPWDDIFTYLVHRRSNHKEYGPYSFLMDYGILEHSLKLEELGIVNVVRDLFEEDIGRQADFLSSTGFATNTLHKHKRLKLFYDIMRSLKDGAILNLHGYCSNPGQMLGAFTGRWTGQGMEPVRADICKLYQSGPTSSDTTLHLWYADVGHLTRREQRISLGGMAGFLGQKI